MKVVYTAPNRAHHYRYAAALNAAGYLYAFVSGFPRISSRAKAIELMGKLHRADILQTIYILSLKCKLPVKINTWLAFLSKIEQDRACRKFVKDCDIFLFYNGSGLSSCRAGKKIGVINIVEAVNSHVEYQEEILEAEHRNLKLPWKPFPENEKRRRLKEYEEADYILMPSEFVKRSFIAKGFREEKLLKVPYGFSKLGNSKKNLNYKINGFTILYVGAISVRKGIRYLIEAFHRLDHQAKRLVLVGPNVGDGALNKVVLTSDIVFMGVLKGEQLEQAYRSADLFCLPSIEEGLALVLGEALSFGLPIIATANSGAEEIISNGKEGFIVPIQNADALYEKLQLLADDPALLESVSKAAMEKSSKLEGWDETGLQLTGILREVLSKKAVNTTL